jgi:hypothetical protein
MAFGFFYHKKLIELGSQDDLRLSVRPCDGQAIYRVGYS